MAILPLGQGKPLCPVTPPSGPPSSEKIDIYNIAHIHKYVWAASHLEHIVEQVLTPVGMIWSMGEQGGEEGHRVKSHAFHDQGEPFPGKVICLKNKLLMFQIDFSNM